MSFHDLPAGRQRIRVDAPGYQPFNSYATVAEDRTGELTVELVPVMGKVRIEADPGTSVTAVTSQGRAIELGTTGADGLLESADLLNIGTYDFKLNKPKHRDRLERGVELILGKTAEVSADLAPLPGKLNVFSVPRGAAIFVNGKPLGTTSTTLTEIPAEEALTVEVRKSGYRTERQTLTLKPAETRELDFGTLVAESGGIALSVTNRLANPGALSFTLDGEEQTSLTLDGLELGEHALSLVHPDYEPWSGTVTVKDGETARVEATLVPKPGRLSLTLSPYVKGAQLYVNGRQQSAIRNPQSEISGLPAERELRLEVRAEGYKTATRTLSLAANGSESWQVSLEKLPGPVAGQDYRVAIGGGEVLEFVWVPALKGWAGKYEVTNGQYRRFKSGHNSKDYIGRSLNGDRQPVVYVSYNDAVAFADWVNGNASNLGGAKVRLPDGNQWTTIAECGDGRKYPWGNSMPPTFGNYDDSTAKSAFGNWSTISGYNDGHAVTCAVEESGRNPWGLYGVGGNVWEWTSEARGSSRVLRGASWFNDLDYILRCDYRVDRGPSFTNNLIGFRLLLFL